ncbi:hypothetical protein E1292_32965 [Nonomuraea deserti]|uniref:DUF3108 domain-containing protein n=1 Tax=Nonomuraea deserti TaxID=1848322 RepID=A0A4R4V6Y0_9ACTN|nr:hypothetical protein [Nonomuraea deserti]TDC99076.1 hypothetical protein E1292_32965 [Nonomuraea deserti]
MHKIVAFLRAYFQGIVMKRIVVGAILAAGLTQFLAAPAQAAPRTDPVKALRATLTPGKSVNIVSTAKVDSGRGISYTLDMDGMVGFGPEGEIASDTSQSLQYSKTVMSGLKEFDMAEDAALEELPLRVISSGHDDYVSGPRFADVLPQGTNWVRYMFTDLPASNPLLDVLETTTLKALLAHRTSGRGGVVKGTIKADKLVEVSRSFASHFRGYSTSKPVSTISYTLHLSSAGLVERVTAIGVLRHWKGSVLRVEADTRYSAWGRQATVALPLKGEVLDQKQLEGKVPYQVPGAWN